VRSIPATPKVRIVTQKARNAPSEIRKILGRLIKRHDHATREVTLHRWPGDDHHAKAAEEVERRAIIAEEKGDFLREDVTGSAMFVPEPLVVAPGLGVLLAGQVLFYKGSSTLRHEFPLD
jgi:hypothetical protein